MTEFINWVASVDITNDRFFGNFMGVCMIVLFVVGLWVIFGSENDDDDLFK